MTSSRRSIRRSSVVSPADEHRMIDAQPFAVRRAAHHYGEKARRVWVEQDVLFSEGDE